MKTTVKKLEAEQSRLQKKIPEKYWSIISKIADIEYRLTMIQEGHESELISDNCEHPAIKRNGVCMSCGKKLTN